MQNHLTSQQVAFMVFLQILGSALVFLPEASAGRNAWISSILAALVGFYVLAIILRLQLMFPGISIFKIAELSLGRIPGKILSSIYLWVVWVISLFYLSDLLSLLRLLFPLLPAFSLRTIIVLTAAYCIYKGVTNIARLAELVIGFVIFLLAVAFLAPLSIADFSNLLPVLSEWHTMAGAAFYGADWPFAEVAVFALLLPLVNDLPNGFRKIIWWYLAAAVVMTLRTVLVLAVLGPEVSGAASVPLYLVFRLVEVQNFQRIELFFFSLWFTTAVIAGLVYYLGVVLGLKELFGLKNYRSLTLPVGLLIVTMSIYMIRSDMYFVQVLNANSFLLFLPINLLYPTIVLLAALIGYKKIKDKLKPPSDTAEQSVELQQ
jgi:spore germination protein KB